MKRKEDKGKPYKHKRLNNGAAANKFAKGVRIVSKSTLIDPFVL